MNAAIKIFFFLLMEGLNAMRSTYTAAIVEYAPIPHHSGISYDEVCKRNAEEYIEAMKDVDRPLDIVVFPEATITTLTAFSSRDVLLNISVNLQRTDKEINPCKGTNYPEYFTMLSCAAKQLNTYIVINTVEKIECMQDVERQKEDCAEEWNLYNANFVFDRNGNLIAKYRKFHLFNEPEMCTTKDVELVTFDTDFGVTFGTFVCFDILFKEPGLVLARRGITHFVYPTMWFAEVPFLTALQAQSMFAAATDVVFLAANANNPKVGSGGSGIYRGVRGGNNITIVSKGGSEMIVTNIYKDSRDVKRDVTVEEDTDDIDRKGARADEFFLHEDTLGPYTSYPIDGDLDVTYCHDNFCCLFKVEAERHTPKTSDYYRYRVFVYSGVRSFHGPKNGGVEVCAIVFCKGDDQQSCAKRILPYSDIEWPITFTNIEIIGRYQIGDHKMQFPNTLLSSLEPIPSESYEWVERKIDGETVERRIKLIKPQSRLLTFGIYGRDYSRDHESIEVKYDKVELYLSRIHHEFIKVKHDEDGL